MNRRGNTLMLLMLALAALAIGGGLVASRMNAANEGRRDDEARTQALWLARSALDAGLSGTRLVETAAGRATVRVQRMGEERWVEVELGGTSLRVDAAPWREVAR